MKLPNTICKYSRLTVLWTGRHRRKFLPDPAFKTILIMMMIFFSFSSIVSAQPAVNGEASAQAADMVNSDGTGVGWFSFIENAWQWIKYTWGLELYNIEGVPIRLNQLVVALIVLIFGSFLSKRIAVMIGKRLERMGHIKKGIPFMIQRILFYLMLIIVILIALPIAGIPTTVFTVVGGALAIGVGFGAQNLFNNLISGIIIMIEQPIRLGDIVELDNSEGRVADIGNRCVRVRRTDGVDVLVPNSHFLEQQVVNWTLFDNDIRGSVKVGVAYGSPTRQVAEIIKAATDNDQRVLRQPEPRVLFEDFGDSALIFRLLFWARVSRPMDLREIQSDLRYRIDEEFNKANIVIAFPQHDVHLDSLSPVAVRVVSDEQNLNINQKG